MLIIIIKHALGAGDVAQLVESLPRRTESPVLYKRGMVVQVYKTTI